MEINLAERYEKIFGKGSLIKEGSNINFNKHIWEGWTVQKFIDELELMFDMIMGGDSWQKPFGMLSKNWKMTITESFRVSVGSC